MLIFYDLFEVDILNNLLEDFVICEGIDNGDEILLDVCVECVWYVLWWGEVVILFDLESQQCQLMLCSEVFVELLCD